MCNSFILLIQKGIAWNFILQKIPVSTVENPQRASSVGYFLLLFGPFESVLIADDYMEKSL